MGASALGASALGASGLGSSFFSAFFAAGFSLSFPAGNCPAVMPLDLKANSIMEAPASTSWSTSSTTEEMSTLSFMVSFTLAPSTSSTLTETLSPILQKSATSTL